MSRTAIEHYLYLLNQAFDGHGEHDLLSNLRSLEPEDWRRLPHGGKRSILEIVRHVGECKFVYENHAFGDGSMRWDRPGTVPTIANDASPEEAIACLLRGHNALIESVTALPDDEELLKLRRANWGMEYQTRWLINLMVQHDLYHAGEINHIRAVCRDDDAWPDYGS